MAVHEVISEGHIFILSLITGKLELHFLIFFQLISVVFLAVCFKNLDYMFNLTDTVSSPLYTVLFKRLFFLSMIQL